MSVPGTPRGGGRFGGRAITLSAARRRNRAAQCRGGRPVRVRACVRRRRDQADVDDIFRAGWNLQAGTNLRIGTARKAALSVGEGLLADPCVGVPPARLCAYVTSRARRSNRRAWVASRDLNKSATPSIIWPQSRKSRALSQSHRQRRDSPILSKTIRGQVTEVHDASTNTQTCNQNLLHFRDSSPAASGA
jgi:hypothetical protein